MSARGGSGGLRSQRDVLADVVDILERAGVPHMLTGSLASSLHGEPRTTLDIDLVVDPSRAQLDSVVKDLEARGYYVDLDAAREAVVERSQFNAIDPRSGWKIDLIIRKETPFARSEFGRRQRRDLGGVEGDVATAEDVVLAKLAWAKIGQSERQLRDVAGILRMTGHDLDREYLEHWVDALDVRDLWNEAGRLAR